MRGTLYLSCRYVRDKEEELKLVGYSDSDSDLARDVNDRKNTTGMIYFLIKSHVTWLSEKQKVVALS